MARESSLDDRHPSSELGALDRRPQLLDVADALSRRVIIDRVRPIIDAGRFPIKRTADESVDVSADIFADGHDVLVAVLRHRPAHGEWAERPMSLGADGTDDWSGQFHVDAIGWHEYQIIAWVDRFCTWRRDLQVRAAAGQDVEVELLEGSMLVREAAARAEQIGAGGRDAAELLAEADALSESSPAAERVDRALEEKLGALMMTYADRSRATTSDAWRIWVDRERARYGAWYEMFPRSSGTDTTRSSTFAEASARLAPISDLGFDVIYLPPIHPIGRSFRKGPNNSPVAGPADPGSPWAIGSEAGGHTAVEPGLGTIEDFIAFRDEAERVGLEVALDLAWQCSPDHPWVREHPEWFRHRPDGTIKYAENPPKKYQDIYPFDFESEDWPSLWRALLDVTLFWVQRGVRIFRVDNPHTKALRFWEWMINEVHTDYPDVLFLSEAFTRPKVMRYLAKEGFSQSYTYFTWRNSKAELTEYFTELTTTGLREYLRPNLFVNTPDILHAYLQQGGRPAFQTRLLLAATLGASYGIYSGFELCENRALAPGSEEYADSEKYQYRARDWDKPGHIKELVARVNQIRRRHRALHVDSTLQFHATDNPQIIAYSKSSPRQFLGSGSPALADATLLTIVNLDPHHMQHGFVQVPMDALGLAPGQFYTVRDLIDDVQYGWRGEWNYVRFDPEIRQGHILRLEPRG